MGGKGKTFEHIGKDSGKKPTATLELFTKDVKKGEYNAKLKAFTDKLRQL